MSKIKVAIIGCGKIANNAHEPAYEAARDISEVKYFCDILPERARALWDKYGSGEVIEDYHVILSDPEVTCVSVCTPNYVHAPITIDCLKAKKHVLCEKPAAVNAELAAEMQKAADDNGMILNIGVCNRFNTAVNKVRESSPPASWQNYHVYCSFRAHRSIPAWATSPPRPWPAAARYIDWGVHFIDLIFFCIAEPAVRTVSAATYCKVASPWKPAPTPTCGRARRITAAPATWKNSSPVWCAPKAPPFP